MRSAKIVMLLQAAAEQYALRGGPVTILTDFLKAACLVAPEKCPGQFSIRGIAPAAVDPTFMGKMTPGACNFVEMIFGGTDNISDGEALDIAIDSVPPAEFDFNVIFPSWAWQELPEDVNVRIDITTLGRRGGFGIRRLGGQRQDLP